MNWHVDEDLLGRYIAAEIDDARAASIEAHVIACAECRARVAGRADSRRVAAVWLELSDAMDQPKLNHVERFLVRLGVKGHIARIIAATPSLTISWLVAVLIALSWAVVAANAGNRGVLAFLIVAPLIPLAGVVFAFGPQVDPMYEVGVAAPMHGFKLMVVRSGCVFGTTLLLIGVASIGLPDIGWKAAAWLLPAIGVSLTSLALSTWMEPVWAGGVVAFGWVATTGLSPYLRKGGSILDQVDAFQPAGQLAFALLIAVAGVVLVVRQGKFDLGRQA